MGRDAFVVAAILAVDQASKAAVLRAYSPLTWPWEVTSYFNLVLVWNRGVSFGLMGGNDGDLQRWALVALAVGVAAVLTVWLARGVDDPLQRWSFRLIVAGAVGNAIDRVVHGAVVDFLDFHYAGWHWPAFNVADSAIVVGAALLVADGLRPRRKAPN
ncbi:MAG: signal peptidase II [Alphaproteobacteria bacterium]|nr:signal peptidase II [Alphaproteobacteria bacterium]